MSLVLVADDEPAVLEVLTEVVEDLGHEVLRAHDGREALTLARQQHPNLVVTDHMMPRLSGIELCRALRNEDALRGIPVILLSAALPPEASEASAYLAKPFELDEFESLVRRTLDGAGIPPPVPLPAARPVDASAQLLQWVAHELKTPLAAAKAHVQLLDRKLSSAAAPSEADLHHVQIVSRQLDDVGLVVDAMLDASRLETGALALDLEKVDLRELASRLIGDWRARHPEMQLELDAPDDAVHVVADGRRVSQVLASLISNAVRHGLPSLRVRVELEADERRAEIRVRDFGPGLSTAAEERLHLVSSASHATDVGPRALSDSATGLGLYIAARVARLHGGTLQARSQAGRGATFTLTLPRNER